ncbi:MAG TPA: arylamine N-acetyltransferase [Anaerolineales bacterium]|nr:arylamine N-acetyltransferase [Anaerolineales bacterium]
MNVEAYLARIGCEAPLEPTYETLRELQTAHMRTVPFENLDIVPLHRSIRLDEASLWHKIIEDKRGGFCYELNGLYAWLLKQIGFQIRYLNGRVFNRKEELGIEFDHLALLASLPGDPISWLADVGFGDSFLEPLELHEGEQPQGMRAYRLEPARDGWISWERGYDRAWRRQYFFDLAPRTFPDDYEAGCRYHQQSPDSSFTRGPVISRATEDGRVTLDDTMLIITSNGGRSERPVSAEEWPRLLWEHFGVIL